MNKIYEQIVMGESEWTGINVFIPDDWPHVELCFISSYGHMSLWERVKNALDILRGKNLYYPDWLSLPWERVHKLADVLDEAAEIIMKREEDVKLLATQETINNIIPLCRDDGHHVDREELRIILSELVNDDDWLEVVRQAMCYNPQYCSKKIEQ